MQRISLLKHDILCFPIMSTLKVTWPEVPTLRKYIYVSLLSKHITSALTAVKDHVLKYSETAFSNSNVNYFWSIKNSSEVIEKLRLRNFRGSQVSSFDFSTLYTSMPHDLIKAKVLSLVNWCFNRESKTYLCTSDKAGFFSNKKYDSYKCWSCAELCEAFTFLMENIYVQFY